MTGNTKVWRAPLAGLASVAMIATMGVAASTANADDPTSAETPAITLDANGGKFNNVKGSPSSVTAEQDTLDTTLTASELNKSVNLATAPLSGEQFTGWYTAAYGGEAYEPGTALEQGATLYAHWSKKPVSLVFVGAYNSDFNNYYSLGTSYSKVSSAPSLGGYDIIKLADGDTISAWQLPQDAAIDGKVDDWQAVADGQPNQDVAYSTLRFTKAEEWLNELPSIYWKQNDAFGENLPMVTLRSTGSTDVHKVTFQSKVGAQSYEFLNNSSHKYIGSDKASDRSFEVKNGEAVNVRIDASEYAAAKVTSAGKNQKVTKWSDADGATYTPDVFNSKTVDRDWTLFPAESKLTYTVTYYNGGKVVATDEVALDGTTTAPSVSRKGYTLKGWSTSQSDESKLFDFSTKIDKPYSLYAVWQATGSVVEFDPDYGTVDTTKVTFADGDYFKAPSASRDGYDFAGWYTSITLPSGATKEVKSDYYEGAKLRIVEGNKLQYLDAHGDHGDDATGEKSDWVNLPTYFYAKWAPAKESALNELEANAYATDHNGKVINYGDSDYSKLFKEASWNQYVKDYQEYLLARKAAANGGLTKTEIAKLYSQLEAAQAKLEVKTNASVYRLYNKQTGDHYFTVRQNEYDGLKTLGVQGEGVKFVAVSAKTAETEVDGVKLSETPFVTALYSVYNQNTGEHLLVLEEEAEGLKAAGWNWDNNEKPVFYAPNAGASEAVRRVYNPNTNLAAHLYTAEAKEYTDLTSWGWKADNDGKPLFYLDAAK